MEKRVLIAIFLSFLVLYVYQALFVKPVPKPAASTTASAPASASASSPAPAAVPPAAPNAAAPATPTAASSATALVGDTSERDVRVETRDIIAVFTNRGARLKSW